MIESILIGVFSSIVASLIFVFLLSKMKPEIRISPQIAKDKDMNGKDIYIIKVINSTRVPVINCQLQLELIKEN